MSDLDLLAELTELGFTEYESKVYLALLRENPATGYHLSKQAGVPRSMVYEALGRLHARGAVLKTNDRRATLYRPLPPEILLERYEQEHHQLMNHLRDHLTALYDARSETHLWTIDGREAVLSYAVQMISKAGSEITLVLADPHLSVMREPLQRAGERGLEINALLTGEGQLDCGQIARHPPLESQLQEITNMLLVVIDGLECLVANDQVEMKATITTNPYFVLIARQFVWMELFTQRIYRRTGADLLARLDPQDRHILEGFSPL
jgi:sugar-specific transcriptional regulator TrmB